MSTMYGGNLVGRDVRKVWREDNVVKLLQFTDGNGAIIVDYLRSLREVQSVAARKVLPPEEVREKVISDYRAALKSVVEAKVICETPKCRIIAEEFPRYWAKGKSLYFANTQAHEATHSKFRQSEEAHGTRVKVNAGTIKHQETLHTDSGLDTEEICPATPTGGRFSAGAVMSPAAKLPAAATSAEENLRLVLVRDIGIQCSCAESPSLSTPRHRRSRSAEQSSAGAGLARPSSLSGLAGPGGKFQSELLF